MHPCRRPTSLPTVLLVVTLLLGGWGTPLLGQDLSSGTLSPWSLEGRAGVTFPLGDFSDGLSSGIGVEITGRYAVSSLVNVYGGVGRASFEAELNGGDFLGGELSSTVVTSGFHGGVILLFSGRNVDPWVKVGGTFHTLGFDLSFPGDSEMGFRSDWRAGIVGGAGVDVPLTGRIRISPSMQFHGYAPDLEVNPVGQAPNVNFLLLDFGVRYVF
ncbi:MAG: hypothetical protein WEA09_09225 [Gemmatimonadota bacterium]